MNNSIYRAISIFTGVLLLAATVFVLTKWSSMPDEIPIHYNFAGEPDDYGGKGFIIFEIIMAWIIFVSLTITVRFPKTWNMPFKVTAQNRAKMYSITRGLLEVIKLLTVLIFIIIMVSSAIAVSLPAWPILLITVMIFVSVVIAIFLMYKNR